MYSVESVFFLCVLINASHQMSRSLLMSFLFLTETLLSIYLSYYFICEENYLVWGEYYVSKNKLCKDILLFKYVNFNIDRLMFHLSRFINVQNIFYFLMKNTALKIKRWRMC